MDTYTIGTLAKEAGVNVETIRYYQHRGLMNEPSRPLGGVRRYAHADRRRLNFIRAAQKLGFSLDEVGELLALEDGRHCHEAEQIGTKKLETVRERLAQLRRVERILAKLVAQCHCNSGSINCPMIAALEKDG
ncbi:MAG: Hg(II)-responsive transcriptional regulator [Acidobacteriota bacterium]|nr:Hg(II)-responsive transcriptional regulator [Acidobacteriota bacterium]